MSKNPKVINADPNFNLAKWSSGETYLHLSPPDFPNDMPACEKWLIPAVLREGYIMYVFINRRQKVVTIVPAMPVGGYRHISSKGETLAEAVTKACQELIKEKNE